MANHTRGVAQVQLHHVHLRCAEGGLHAAVNTMRRAHAPDWMRGRSGTNPGTSPSGHYPARNAAAIWTRVAFISTAGEGAWRTIRERDLSVQRDTGSWTQRRAHLVGGIEVHELRNPLVCGPRSSARAPAPAVTPSVWNILPPGAVPTPPGPCMPGREKHAKKREKHAKRRLCIPCKRPATTMREQHPRCTKSATRLRPTKPQPPSTSTVQPASGCGSGSGLGSGGGLRQAVPVDDVHVITH